MSLFNGHICVGSFATTESALAEIRKLLAIQAPHEVLLISVDIATPPDKARWFALTQRPATSSKTIRLFRSVLQPAQAGSSLTPHELRILRLLVEGHNYKTAASALGVSVNTISFHVRRVYEKLNVHSKAEAVAKALRDNLV